MKELFIISAAMAALYYIPTLLKVLKLEFSVRSLMPVGINADSIDLVLGLEIYNPGSKAVNINSMDIDVSLGSMDKIQVGKLAGGVHKTVNGHSKEIIRLPMTLDYQTAGAEMIQQLIAGNMENFGLQLSGTVTADGREFPFSQILTKADFS